MKINVLGAGFYGCHIGLALLRDGYDVEVHEIAPDIFAGASGGIPARVHQGQHYPRSGATRTACQQHHQGFMDVYGHLTDGVRTNIYAIASDSLVDYSTYCKILKDEIEYIQILKPEEYGLKNVEGAILTGERHVVLSRAKAYFKEQLGDSIHLNSTGRKDADLTIDCTFCANDSANVDRYEPCLTVIMDGPDDTAVTIMDGPFPSIYPWDKGLCSLTSAAYTPFSRDCKTWDQAKRLIDSLRQHDIDAQAEKMTRQMAGYYEDFHTRYHIHEYKLSIRAMPSSKSDARLVDVVQTAPDTLRIRAGKIDAILHAEEIVRKYL